MAISYSSYLPVNSELQFMSLIQFPVVGTELRIQMVETRWQVNCQDCQSNKIFSNHLLGQIGNSHPFCYTNACGCWKANWGCKEPSPYPWWDKWSPQAICRCDAGAIWEIQDQNWIPRSPVKSSMMTRCSNQKFLRAWFKGKMGYS